MKKLFCDKFAHEDQSPLRATEPMIQEFHLIDPTGQSLRYERDHDGKRYEHESISDFVSLDNLREKFDGIYTFLDCCQSMLIDEISCWDEP